jgi:hypothetical protein
MIRVILLGRTGNNLFQYAFGRALAERHGVPLVMDGAWYNNRTWRGVSALGRLPLRCTLERNWSIASRLLLKTTGRHLHESKHLPLVAEPATNHRFNPAFQQAPADCLVKGYFQSHLYFQHLESELRQELAMSGLPWSDATCRLADRMQRENSVAIHVRRTDYIGNPDVAVCDINYYLRAIDRLRSRNESLSFHVFSDDPSWCGIHFSGSGFEVHAFPEAHSDPLHDLYLMSRAQHHIICNSSYSWWAAWLAHHPSQQVIMPDRWYASGIHAPITEKQCAGWETISGMSSPDDAQT